MRASTAIYRYIIKPAFAGAVACLIAWVAVRFFGVTKVFGWDIKFGWVFFYGFMLMSIAADFLWPSKKAEEASETSVKPLHTLSGSAGPGQAARPAQAFNAPIQMPVQPQALPRLLVQASGDQTYFPREGNFRVVQDGRTVPMANGLVELAKRPFEVVYDGPCAQQAILFMETPALNVTLDSTGLFTVWGHWGEAVARSPEDLIMTKAERVLIADTPAARRSLMAVAAGQAPTLLEELVSREPQLEVAIRAPRMPLHNRSIRFRTIEGSPIESCGDQVLHLTHLAMVSGFGEGGNHWIQKLEWGGFAIHLSNRSATSAADNTIQDMSSEALKRGEAHYEAGELPAAYEAFMEAMVLGNARACYFVGEMLQNGMGVDQDYAEGRKLLQAAAEAGDPDAMYSVACGYGNGHAGFPKDDAKAVSFMRTAADAGHADALAALGNMYETGQGVPRDQVKAHELYKAAKARGSSLVDLYLEGAP